MAIDLSKATKATKAAPLTYQEPVGGNPFTGSGQGAQTGVLPSAVSTKPQNDYTDPKNFATVPGKFDPLRATLKAQNPGIPASFIDDEIDNLNSGRTRDSNSSAHLTGNPDPNDPAVVADVSRIINQEWQSEPDRQRYITTDATAVSSQQTNDILKGGDRTDKTIGDNETSSINNFYGKYVTPSLDAAAAAPGQQATADRTAEGQLTGIAQQYAGSLDKSEADRTSGIDSTNATELGLANQYSTAAQQTSDVNNQWASQFVPIADKYNALDQGLTAKLSNQTDSTNAANLQLGQQINQAAADTNANQTGLYNTLSGQASSINDNQTQLFNQLAAQAAQSNSALNGANSTFQGQLGQLNDQQMAADTMFQQQLSQENGLDRSSLANYMGETQPLMSTMTAQGSDPADVAAQRDVVQRYKDLSNPEVTDQERLVAELARRKFESDDQSNREALMQQLRGRGLQSGGLVVAGLQSANQQTANDRQIAEMGLNSQADQRAMTALQGYGDQSSVLRNADDAMRNFQDQYAQNDAVRRGNLAGQREDINLAETNQETGRYQAGFNATTTSLNNNTTRDSLGFDANRSTIADNYNRDQNVFNSGTTTNEDNYGRDQSVYNAGTQTNVDNFGRTDTANNRNLQINQDNIGNTQQATTINSGINNTDANRSSGAVQANINTNEGNFLNNTGPAIKNQQTTVDANNTRTQGGIDKGETAAGTKANALAAPLVQNINDTNTETGNKLTLGSQASSGGATFATVAGGVAGDQRAALDRMLARYGLGKSTDLASGQV